MMHRRSVISANNRHSQGGVDKPFVFVFAASYLGNDKNAGEIVACPLLKREGVIGKRQLCLTRILRFPYNELIQFRFGSSRSMRADLRGLK